tara:strand:+ start:6659 stop:6883 length:225 start_codon:yes stop_codon:yes gene_type:complete
MAKPLWYYPDGSYYGEDGFIYKDLPKSSTKMFTIYKELMAKSFPEHGRTCECYPCQQANYRMDRDDPSVGGDEE